MTLNSGIVAYLVSKVEDFGTAIKVSYNGGSTVYKRKNEIQGYGILMDDSDNVYVETTEDGGIIFYARSWQVIQNFFEKNGFHQMPGSAPCEMCNGTRCGADCVRPAQIAKAPKKIAYI